VVVHVAEVRAALCVDQGRVEAREAIADVDQRRDGALQAEQVTLQIVDVLGGLAAIVAAEDLFLELLEVLLELVDDREVVVDDEVHEGIEHEARALLEEVRRALAAVTTST
jgi:hypothetical protein